MSRNYFPGNCLRCGVFVPVGSGYWQGRRVRCVACKGQGNEPATPRAKEQRRKYFARAAVADFVDVEPRKLRTFKIQFTDPKTGETIEAVRQFEDTASLSAWEWAEDWAYGRADKGSYRVTETP